MLATKICGQERAGRHRRKQPRRGAQHDRKTRHPRLDLFASPRCSSIGLLATFAQQIRRREPSHDLCAHEQNQKIIEEPDYWNETRNELNRAEHVRYAARCYASYIPRRAWIPKHKVKNKRLFLQTLRLLLPGVRRLSRALCQSDYRFLQNAFP